MCVFFPMKVQLFSPAKINVFLSVLGPRPDGFHDLLSIVCPLNFGDSVSVELREDSEFDQLECDHPEVPKDLSNLALRAVDLFRSVHPFPEGVNIQLSKKIPMGGGMGGGSGNGSAVLWGLNQLMGQPLTKEQLVELAATLGSDCPLFLKGGAVLMKGRGEIIENLSTIAYKKLCERTVYLLLPGIPISTAWAYGRFREPGATAYDSKVDMESRVFAFIDGGLSLEELLHNNFEPLVYKKYIALAVFKNQLDKLVPNGALLSGSGSTLFVLAPEDSAGDNLEKQLKALGEDAFGKDFELVKATTAPFESAAFVHMAASGSEGP